MRGLKLSVFLLLVLTIGLQAPSSHGAASGDPEAASLELARALRFYYDGDYGRALPLFRNLSDRMATADLMFWTGTSAARAGECDLAVEQLRQLLERRPDLDRARLELGIAYSRCGETDRARAEFEGILAGSAPPEVRNAAKNRLARLEAGGKALDWRIRFSQGYKYDDNITSGPDEAVIDDAGIPIRLDGSVREKSGDNWITGLRADLLYDLGAAGGLFWNGGLDFYYSHSLEDSDYHYMKTDLFTGPWWNDKKNIAKAPVGYTYKRYAGDPLSGTVHFTPSYERRFSRTLGVAGSYRLEVERYDEEKYTDAGYDNESHTISMGPNLYLMDRRLVLSGRLAYELLEADADRYSYDAAHLSASVFTAFATDTELFLLYKWSDKTYDGPAAAYADDREDSRHTVVAVLAQNFLEHFFAALEAAYIDNSSNSDLYDFDKTTLTLSVGLNY